MNFLQVTFAAELVAAAVRDGLASGRHGVDHARRGAVDVTAQDVLGVPRPPLRPLVLKSFSFVAVYNHSRELFVGLREVGRLHLVLRLLPVAHLISSRILVTHLGSRLGRRHLPVLEAGRTIIMGAGAVAILILHFII